MVQQSIFQVACNPDRLTCKHIVDGKALGCSREGYHFDHHDDEIEWAKKTGPSDKYLKVDVPTSSIRILGQRERNKLQVKKEATFLKRSPVWPYQWTLRHVALISDSLLLYRSRGMDRWWRLYPASTVELTGMTVEDLSNMNSEHLEQQCSQLDRKILKEKPDGALFKVSFYESSQPFTTSCDGIPKMRRSQSDGGDIAGDPSTIVSNSDGLDLLSQDKRSQDSPHSLHTPNHPRRKKVTWYFCAASFQGLLVVTGI
jgi:hypothetical protein